MPAGKWSLPSVSKESVVLFFCDLENFPVKQYLILSKEYKMDIITIG